MRLKPRHVNSDTRERGRTGNVKASLGVTRQLNPWEKCDIKRWLGKTKCRPLQNKKTKNDKTRKNFSHEKNKSTAQRKTKLATIKRIPAKGTK